MKKMMIASLIGTLAGTAALPTMAQVIDDFEVGAIAPLTDNTDDFTGEHSFQLGLPTNQVIGGVRDALIFLGTAGSTTMELDLSGPGDHGLEMTITPNTQAFMAVNYDGGDPNTGLGSIDLSDGGNNDGLTIEIEMDPNLEGELFTRVTDPNFAVAVTVLNGSGTYFVPFENFNTGLDFENSRPHEGDFTQVGSVSVEAILRNLTPNSGSFKILSINAGDGNVGCDQDITGDGVIDLSDLAEVLAAFGEVGVGLPADVNNDGSVDLTDLAEILGNFGTSC